MELYLSPRGCNDSGSIYSTVEVGSGSVSDYTDAKLVLFYSILVDILTFDCFGLARQRLIYVMAHASFRSHINRYR